MASLSEDDVYRSSTQYRFWSFAPDALASMRTTTNAAAAEGVRAAVASAYQKRGGSEGRQTTNGLGKDRNGIATNVDCLDVDEEQKLVGFYCVKAMQLADFCEFPTNVKATAVQYLKRFYLSNSPMTYHPKQIMPSALFLSTKTENHYTSLHSFVSKLPKIKQDDVVAPEFLLTQGLRFAFDVRHPHRGLEGGFMELMGLAHGQRGQILKSRMMEMKPSKHFTKPAKTTEMLVQRIQHGHGIAKGTLKSSALLTDVYFQFTPSQIWLSAYLLADEPLIKLYLRSKLAENEELYKKLLTTLQRCCRMLESSPSADPGAKEMEDLMRIDKKLYKCRNPDKIDLVGMNKAQKREGDGSAGDGLDEKTIKKRRLERKHAEEEANDVFGPAIG
ncbi:uncharacterized protein KY384_003916 [Bacidia gigantensis]|uniref:uncharacterized protein n=1 Tax=Bacidia gigantensis TaxID=2732470 RepID=UPI001D049F21|nr:uncharacterized protein KY384_003916 [Bacidia gigantensis]KAG8532275.1 hypothetical protein KY384_003916 [Bacidia gigantensis]